VDRGIVCVFCIAVQNDLRSGAPDFKATSIHRGQLTGETLQQLNIVKTR
jgi:hypothetical protein